MAEISMQKQTLVNAQKQEFRLTPQIVQANYLLQRSAAELQAEVRALLNANPMLEVIRETTATEAADANLTDPENEDEAYQEPYAQSAQSADERKHEADDDISFPDSIPDEALLGDGADYDPGPATLRRVAHTENERISSSYSAYPELLRDRLLRQVDLNQLSSRQEAIARLLVDAIDENGYLEMDPEEIAEIFLAEQESTAEVGEIEQVLLRFQQFDPPGIGARDLTECLLIQLGQLPAKTPWLQDAIQLLEKHKDTLEARDYARLEQQAGTANVRGALALLQTLNPKPGAAYTGAKTDYIVPDVLIRKRRGVWRAVINPHTMPKVRINPEYRKLTQNSRLHDFDTEGRRCLRDLLQEAECLMDGVRHRFDILSRVAAKILSHQIAFMEHGPEAMKPLVQREIAEDLGVDNSTISRAINGKYMDTPHGIREFLYFFSSHVSGPDGGISSVAVRSMIAKCIAAEDRSNPYSDEQIVAILAEQGVQVARRTIVKYRKLLNIRSSSARRQPL